MLILNLTGYSELFLEKEKEKIWNALILLSFITRLRTNLWLSIGSSWPRESQIIRLCIPRLKSLDGTQLDSLIFHINKILRSNRHLGNIVKIQFISYLTLNQRTLPIGVQYPSLYMKLILCLRLMSKWTSNLLELRTKELLLMNLRNK